MRMRTVQRERNLQGMENDGQRYVWPRRVPYRLSFTILDTVVSP